MLRPAIIFEDNTIFVSMTPEEFVEIVDKLLKSGKTLKEAMDQTIIELKRKTLTK